MKHVLVCDNHPYIASMMGRFEVFALLVKNRMRMATCQSKLAVPVTRVKTT